MISLTIAGKHIELIPLDIGEEIWSNIIIEKIHRDSQGSYIGIRKSLLDVALQRRVKWLNIQIKEINKEINIAPREFVTKSKMMEMPSKYRGTYKLFLYPISDLVIANNKLK